MNSNAPPEQPPPRKKGFFARLCNIPARMSLPVRGAAVTAIFLFALVTVVWVVFWLDPNNIPWRHAMTLRRISIVIGLAILLPLLVYEGLRLWLEGDRSRFPDIEFAWNAGVGELAQHGLLIEAVPLFVIVGSHSDEQERALMDAAGMELVVRGVPEGSAPLHWYAYPGGIFLFLTEANCLSALAALLMKRADAAAGRSASTATNFLAADEPDIGLTFKRSADLTRRLQHVCGLINRARQPLCPCNGILTLLPFSAVKINEESGEEFQRAIKSDLITLQEKLQVHCPVMSLVVGMEHESGFRELVRRIGADRAYGQRFGMGFDVRGTATAEELSVLAAHVSGRFENWIYSLFREPGALSRPGNRHLFSLLCQVRSVLQVRLAKLLAGGFGRDSLGTPILFCGCYFAAAGDTKDRQAFVKGAVEKMVDEQEHVEWTQETLSDDRRYARMVNMTMFLNAMLFLALLVMIVRRALR